MKKKTRKIKQEPGTCPKCGSNNINYRAFEIDGVYYEAECDKCGCEFQECYELKFEENIIINEEV